MKKAIHLFICIATIVCSYAQETPSETSKPLITKEDYLKKSKGQRTGAIVLIAGGGAMVIAGAVLVTKSIDIFYDDPANDSDETLGSVLVIGGLAAMLGSIPLFISAHKNKKHAMSISFKNETVPLLQNSMVFHRYVPSLSLSIRL